MYSLLQQNYFCLIICTRIPAVVGGYVVFEIMRKLFPDFAIFQGDMIAADTPIERVKLIDQSIANGNWTNDPFEDPGIVAATTNDFRAKWKVNTTCFKGSM